MPSVIYWFSGTGNSLSVAKAIAEETGAALIPIASVMNKDVITPDADAVGIVFPVYYAGLPAIIAQFVSKLEGIRDKYIFAVCTYGGGPGNSMKALGRLIESKGGRLSAVFGLHMPQNAFKKPWENAPKVLAEGAKTSRWIALKINAGKQADRPCHPFWRPFQFIIYSLVQAALKKGLAAHSGSSPDLDMDELIHRVDQTFTVSEACNACGTCAQLCPVRNIEMADGKPAWLHRCENCLACYDWCPRKAIRSGIVQQDHFYRHPEVHLSDISVQSAEQ